MFSGDMSKKQILLQHIDLLIILLLHFLMKAVQVHLFLYS